MAIQQLEMAEVEQVSGAGFLTPLAVALGISPDGLLGGGGGTLGGGGFVRGFLGSIPIIGPLLVFGEAAL